MRLKVEKLYEECQKIIVEAGKKINKVSTKNYQIILKDNNEFITEVDLSIQKYIVGRINSLGNYNFILEEQRKTKEVHKIENCFVIDPIDGTHNFIAGLPNFAIAIAYVDNGVIQFGIIHIPKSGDTYKAMKDIGAYKNNKKIAVSTNNDIKKSIIAYDNQFYKDEKVIKNYKNIVSSVFTTRISGSACIDSCYISEGVLDARILNSTNIYDIAAGSRIIEEAGGVVTDFHGKKITLTDVKSVILSSGMFHNKLLKIISAEN
tara:strand:- start:1592 stop:2377 length:786 start_codon:yes stop_codon:yes gene_type:complete